MKANAKSLFDKAASMAERDIIKRYAGSIYRLEYYSRGWILRADGVAIGGPYANMADGVAALDSVAPD